MIKNIGLKLVLIFVLFSCNTQEDKKKTDSKILYKDSEVLFDIIFADGFKSDEILFKINEEEIIKTKLKSDESDGLTSLAYRIIKRDKKIVIIHSYEDNIYYSINDNKQKIELSVLYEDKRYNFILQEGLGKYVLIELNNVITFKQQKRRPIFE